MKKVCVIGAGTMGNGIAHLFAQNGREVALVDVSQDQLNKALATISKNLDRQVGKGSITADTKENTLKNIVTHTSLASGLNGAELVVEAATENIELKLSIFRQIDEFAPPGCILASNTSSISITRIAAATGRPANVIGMHFMNPVPVMKLVEVINGYATDEAITDAIVALSKELGKTP